MSGSVGETFALGYQSRNLGQLAAMSFQYFYQAIEEYHKKLYGIAAGGLLWNQLVAANRITWVRRFLEGVLVSGINLQILNNNIFVHVNPHLSVDYYELPSSK